jgi:hypothetical protein
MIYEDILDNEGNRLSTAGFELRLRDLGLSDPLIEGVFREVTDLLRREIHLDGERIVFDDHADYIQHAREDCWEDIYEQAYSEAADVYKNETDEEQLRQAYNNGFRNGHEDGKREGIREGYLKGFELPI